MTLTTTLSETPRIPGAALWRGHRCLLPVTLARRYPDQHRTVDADGALAMNGPHTGDGGAPSASTVLLDAYASSLMEGVCPAVEDFARAAVGAPAPADAYTTLRCSAMYQHTATYRRVSSAVLACATVLTGAAPAWRGGLVRIDSITPGADPYTPPPVFLTDLLEDLDIFAQVHGHGPDPVATAAIVHGQFEAIHPLPDGNGRAGRAVLAQALWRSGAGGSPTVFLARHREDYIAALVAFTGTPARCGDDGPLRALVAQATFGPPLPDPRTPVTRDEDCAAQGGYTRVDSDIWMLTELWESAHAVRSAVVGHL